MKIGLLLNIHWVIIKYSLRDGIISPFKRKVTIINNSIKQNIKDDNDSSYNLKVLTMFKIQSSEN